MNNAKKFNLTVEAVSELQKQILAFQEEANKLKGDGEGSYKYLNAISKVLSTSSLSIDMKKGIISINIKGIYYAQPIYLKRRRINAVPSCFLIQLYKEVLKEEKLRKEELVDIPFELKGFWKIEKALEFFEELNGRKLFWIRDIQRITNYKRENKEKVDEALNGLSEAIETFEILPSKKGCIEIKMNDESFNVRTRNMKLNIVPLCKVIVTYYVTIINQIEECKNVGAKYKYIDVNRVIMNIMNDFDMLVDKYFMIPMVKS